MFDDDYYASLTEDESRASRAADDFDSAIAKYEYYRDKKKLNEAQQNEFEALVEYLEECVEEDYWRELYTKGYVDWIGKKVSKAALKTSKSTKPKPFKSTLLENTVKDIIIHPTTKRSAFTFHEDDSYVECRVCSLVN